MLILVVVIVIVIVIVIAIILVLVVSGEASKADHSCGILFNDNSIDD